MKWWLKTVRAWIVREMMLRVAQATVQSAEARQAWAHELARLIRKPTLPELNGEALSGGVEPLTGATWLLTMLACLFVVSVAFVVLLAVYLKLSQS